MSRDWETFSPRPLHTVLKRETRPHLLTFMHARVLVLDHSQLVDLAELLKDGLQVLFLQIAWDLPDEEFDGVGLLHWVDDAEKVRGTAWVRTRDERAESERE